MFTGCAISARGCRRAGPRMRDAFTVVEFLIVIGVIALVMALVLPAVMASREAARRGKCTSNLHQVGMAVGAYVDAFLAFPPGGSAKGLSWHTAVLPQMDLAPQYGLAQQNAGPYDPANAALRTLSVPEYLCPSDGASAGRNVTNYAGNYGRGLQAFGYDGLFRPFFGSHSVGESSQFAYPIRVGNVIDGLSNTAAVSEMLAGNDAPDPLRNVWQTPTPLLGAQQLQAFASACASFPGVLTTQGRGWPWDVGDILYTGYVHVLPPGDHSCTNGGVVQEGVYTATSAHPGGVNTLLADGHVKFMLTNVDILVWTAIGSRNGGEAHYD